MTSPLILREGDTPQLVQLPRAVADALAGAGVVQLTRTDRDDWWLATPGTQVGVVSVGGLQVVIEPKVDLNRLVFLLGYARRPDFWRDDRVVLDDDVDLPHALAEAFVRLARIALGQGLLKGYVTVDESSPVLRGRVREADQIRRRWGRNVPLEVRYDEYTVDIAENQLLLAAVGALLRMPVGAHLRSRLQHLRLQLADVTAPPRGSALPTWTPSRLNARYVPALQIAELILAGRSFDQRSGDLMVSGYLLNMATLFEDFVTTALSEAMRRFGGVSLTQFRTYLDEGRLVPIRPDFVWSVAGRPRLVLDAKYKAEKPSGFPQADLYQMLAYCTVLGLPAGHLVYAKGFEDERTHVVVGSGVRVVAHTLDLEESPDELLAAVGSLAAEVVRRDDR
ncbi:McrC family protein [Aestuariimicrobium soli]|uniref:McrC family protein n=1 Tax=Aestuariimicrobium soli TaxID=2035834 RepID=UPI003EBA479A